MNMKVLVDSDSIYFRPACKVAKAADMRRAIDHSMSEIERQCWSDDFMVAIKGSGNFRKDLFPDYKATRKPLDRRVADMLSYGIEYFKEKYDAVEADDMEADDLCSIWAKDCRDFEVPHTVVGIDKDLLQIPGNHYNFVKKEHQFVDETEADMKLMLQCLTGDTSDNIPGLKGIGPKKADKMLAGSQYGRRWNRVKAAWRGHNAGDAHLSWRLLTMLTSFEEHEQIMQHTRSEATKSETIRFLKENCDNGKWKTEGTRDELPETLRGPDTISPEDQATTTDSPF